MNALDPIAGITLERYAELCALMKDCGGDLEVCARIAQENGVDRATWQAAMDGWNQRMQSPATSGQVAVAYMPLYQAALARTGGVFTASYEDYVGMSAMLRCSRFGLDAMYAHYGIDPQKWSQISVHWVNEITKDNALGQRFDNECTALIGQLNAGAPPPPAGRGDKPQAQSAEAVAEAAQSLASKANPAHVSAMAPGQGCLVQWNDGNRYPGHVREAKEGKLLVAFPNGREEWIPAEHVSPA